MNIDQANIYIGFTKKKKKRNQLDQRIDDRSNIEIPEEIIENITSRSVKGKFDDFFRDTRGFGSFDSIRRRERKGRCV
jgi:hypothetical protein